MKLETTLMLLAAAVVGFFTGALWTAGEPVVAVIAATFIVVPVGYMNERITDWLFQSRMRERLRQ